MFKSLIKRNTSTQLLTFHFLPVSSLLFTAKLLERASLYSVYPHFTSHPILSHHTTKCLSPRAPFIFMLLNLTCFSSPILLDIGSAHCWLSTQLLFLHSSFTAKPQFYSGFYFLLKCFREGWPQLQGQTASGLGSLAFPWWLALVEGVHMNQTGSDRKELWLGRENTTPPPFTLVPLYVRECVSLMH